MGGIKRSRPTFARIYELERQVVALEVMTRNAEHRIGELQAALESAYANSDRLKVRQGELEATAKENGYWERHWRGEAEARQWAEARLYRLTKQRLSAVPNPVSQAVNPPARNVVDT